MQARRAREREGSVMLHTPTSTKASAMSEGMRPLAGKTAIVTGSTSGIGLGIATAFAMNGADVLINGFGEKVEIDRNRAMLESYGVKAAYSAANMSEPDQIMQMVELARESFGKVDILVNNAGIQHVAPIEDFPIEKWNTILAINLSSAFHASRAVLPEMKARGWGRIINVASVHGLIASPFKAAYVAAKHGIIGLTKVIALEAAEQGVTCNAICPGYVWTPLVEKQIDDQARAHNIGRDQVISDVLLKQQPTKKFAQIDEMAALSVFLCGNH